MPKLTTNPLIAIGQAIQDTGLELPKDMSEIVRRIRDNSGNKTISHEKLHSILIKLGLEGIYKQLLGALDNPEVIEEEINKVRPLDETPKNTFQGIKENGSPIKFLQEHYGQWINTRTLAQIDLQKLDRKLYLAVLGSRRNINNPGELHQYFPALFPSKEGNIIQGLFVSDKIAKENRLKFGI